MLSRRSFIASLIAMPAVVHASNLMPLRGIKFDPIVRLQSWPIGTDALGEYWVHEGPLSRARLIEKEMRDMLGNCYWEDIDTPKQGPIQGNAGYSLGGAFDYVGDNVNASRFGVRMTAEEKAEHHRQAFEAFPVRAIPYEPMTVEQFNTRTDNLRKQLASVCKWGS
jgi:hypothetical protein